MFGRTGGGNYIYNNAELGKGEGPIWMDDIQCAGGEGDLFMCERRRNGHDCSHSEDLGVYCSGKLQN